MAMKSNKKNKQSRLQVPVVDFDQLDERIEETGTFAFFADELLDHSKNGGGPVARIVLSKLIALDFDKAIGGETETVRIGIIVLPKSGTKTKEMLATEAKIPVDELVVDGEIPAAALAIERSALDGISQAREHFEPGKLLFEWEELPG